MSSSVPPNFIDLKTARERINYEVNVMGVITDWLPPRLSRGSDWMCSFSISDSTCNCYGDPQVDGLRVRFFRPTENEMPAIRGPGDVVLIRFLKITMWSGMTMGLSNKGTSWTVFPAISIPVGLRGSQSQLKHVKETRAPAPSFAEMRYATNLYESRDSSLCVEPVPVPMDSSTASSSAGSGPAALPWRDKYALIKDIAFDKYCDLVGQVVKIYPHSDRVELYLTDYTANNLLFNYEWGQDDEDESVREGDAYNYVPRFSSSKKWPGPFGKMTLTITLWPPHAYFSRQNVKENDYVFLRNVHIKFSKDSKLEGVLHSDRRYPDRIDVTILKDNESDDRVKDVLRRKRDYTKKFQKSSEELVAEARGLKRKHAEEPKTLSKTAQRKKRKKERERLANAESHHNDELHKENDGKAAKKGNLAENSRSEMNTQNLNNAVKCSNHLITPRPLSTIISLCNHENTTPDGTSYTLPFQNINSRATVRVVDFFPSELADFAVQCPKSSEFDILSDAGDSQRERESESENEDHSSDTDNGADEERPWEWRFQLKLQDAMGPKNEDKATVEVYVAGQDAECLLKLDAENLRKSPKPLAVLREKLFLLWGDLEERKSEASTALKDVSSNPRVPKKEEAPRNKPFQCCLKEYGVKKRVQQTERGEEDNVENEVTDAPDEWVWERRWRMFGTTII